MISMSATARGAFEELRRAGKPRLGIQVGFMRHPDAALVEFC